MLKTSIMPTKIISIVAKQNTNFCNNKNYAVLSRANYCGLLHFFRSKKYGGVPKMTNIRYGASRCDPCGPSIAFIDDNSPPCVRMLHSKYLLLNECLNWKNAVNRCSSLKSRLALPKSIEENQEFLDDAKNLDFVFGFWIALTETPEGGSWVDDQGQNPTFTNWDDGFPTINNTSPTAVIVQRDGTWQNWPKDWKKDIIALCV